VTEYQRRPADSDVLPPRIADDSPAARSHEGQLALLHGYFTLQAYGGVAAGAVLLLSRIARWGPIIPIPAHPWVAIPAFALGTWASFRTRRILRNRDQEGALMAGAVFAWNLVTAAATGHVGFGSLLTGLGALFSVNVYRHLRREADALDDSGVYALD